MPLKLNVGASRKVTDNNYGSRGASVNLEMELDTTLVNEPPRLQERIRHLFQVARTSLAEELNGGSHHTNGHATPTTNGDHPQAIDRRSMARATSGSSTASVPRSTTSQSKALHAIAHSHGIHLADFLRNQLQVRRPEDLKIRQASAAIDELKATGVGRWGRVITRGGARSPIGGVEIRNATRALPPVQSAERCVPRVAPLRVHHPFRAARIVPSSSRTSARSLVPSACTLGRALRRIVRDRGLLGVGQVQFPEVGDPCGPAVMGAIRALVLQFGNLSLLLVGEHVTNLLQLLPDEGKHLSAYGLDLLLFAPVRSGSNVSRRLLPARRASARAFRCSSVRVPCKLSMAFSILGRYSAWIALIFAISASVRSISPRCASRSARPSARLSRRSSLSDSTLVF